ncbi:periplasmic binding protein/LacI transcriptional regulator [Gluconacetobacter diazotrophicus PA1 5]|uniref:ABC transporter substrate-binding protein n=2 Tax=Gluconacetobacter diazotrophicus TaxID=33996 RepID=A0A7W4I756_GLUDI|nr:ABC transporter substrate-binding protein [Gluconacetobacter diazotrophicus]ACI50631.1 periplasmic binding protein/LacI transcriptional regulator [Gluconacetobacter diazotrophicus PA1 5]MBB2157501.1 ABC transporter substrate-binding protein [Gluconacetobacter diazotrophicus]TWB09463.1 monosaccharide ABC transporter substrate-binding protein (CUT2 family) [Gluconacetobacter diazotrophicus]CAP56569.1 putative D-ribose-binding protein precursor [Gluconacetobacter diazotrophicus PA1 5]
MTFKSVLLAGLAVLSLAAPSLAVTAAQAKPITGIGVSLGTLGNPYFVALVKGVTAEAAKVAPNARITSVSADYDLNKQFSQIDNFIASGDNLLLINAVDPQAILPAIKRAQKAGAVVVVVDVGAAGADAVVQTDNVAAGRLSCEYLAQKIGGKGNVAIQNGPQVSSVLDRVKGCKEALAKSPGITIVTDDQNGQGSRDAGFAVMQGYVVRFPDLAGVFTINDPQAIGSDLAARQAHRSGIVITSVDGAPDIVTALKDKTSSVLASSSQDPYQMGIDAVIAGQDLLDDKLKRGTVQLIMPKLITRDNVDSYQGWTNH